MDKQMKKEELLEKAVELSEAIEALPASLSTLRQKLEKQRDALIKKARRPGNPTGNIASIQEFQFQQKGEEPLAKTLTFRVSERQFSQWQNNRATLTKKFRKLLNS